MAEIIGIRQSRADAELDKTAESIAKRLRAFGYPDVTAAMVKEQLTLEPSERNIIGMFAADMAGENE